MIPVRPRTGRIGVALFFLLISIIHTNTEGGQRTPPYSPEPGVSSPFMLIEKEILVESVDSDHSTGAGLLHRVMVFPESPGIDGVLAPASPPLPIDPITTPQHDPVSAVVSYNYGVSQFNARKFSLARQEWKTALGLHPRFPEAQYALSYLSYLQGNHIDAVAHMSHARDTKPDWPGLVYYTGVLAYESGHFHQASQAFLKGQQLFPDDPAVLNGLGLSKLREGHLPEALQALGRAHESAPNLACVHLNLGLVYIALHQWEKAKEELTETLRLDPTLQQTYVWLGITHASTGDWTRAISSWQRTVGMNPHHPQIGRVYYNLGTAYWMTGNPFEARQAYRTAIHHHSDWPQAFYQLGVIDMTLIQWKEAGENFLKAIQLAPEWDSPYLNLGLVRYNQGLIEDARKAFQLAVTLQPDSPDANYYLGLTLRITHQDDSAVPALERAARNGHTTAQEMLGGMYANGRGTPPNLTQAMRWWHRAANSHQSGQAADHARAQLSRLRQLYFLHQDNPSYAQGLMEGFQAIQQDLRAEQRKKRADFFPSDQHTGIGIALASTGRLAEAIPVLIREAYTIDPEAHRYLERLLQEGELERLPGQQNEVIQYFLQTAAEGSLDSCRLLNSLSGLPEIHHASRPISYAIPESCLGPRP